MTDILNLLAQCGGVSQALMNVQQQAQQLTAAQQAYMQQSQMHNSHMLGMLGMVNGYTPAPRMLETPRCAYCGVKHPVDRCRCEACGAPL